jgi:hypothetical protein
MSTVQIYFRLRSVGVIPKHAWLFALRGVKK